MECCYNLDVLFWSVIWIVEVDNIETSVRAFHDYSCSISLIGRTRIPLLVLYIVLEFFHWVEVSIILCFYIYPVLM